MNKSLIILVISVLVVGIASFFARDIVRFISLSLTGTSSNCEYQWIEDWYYQCPDTANVEYCKVNAWLRTCWDSKPSPYGVIYGKFSIAGTSYSYPCREVTPSYKECWNGKYGYYFDDISVLYDLPKGKWAKWESASAMQGTCTNKKYISASSKVGWVVYICYKECQEGWLDEYKCVGDERWRKWQHSDCTTEWRFYENCNDKDGWYCYDSDTREYRDYYCSGGAPIASCPYTSRLEDCPPGYRCENGRCISVTPKGEINLIFIGMLSILGVGALASFLLLPK